MCFPAVKLSLLFRLLLCSMATISSSPLLGNTGHLGCKAEWSAGQARAEWRTGQDRRTGYRSMSLYGQTLDWHGRGQLSGAKVVYGLLSAGTHGQPDPVHLVDDFQRADQDKLCVSMCVWWCGVKNYNVHSWMLVWTLKQCMISVFAPFLHINSMCVYV